MHSSLLSTLISNSNRRTVRSRTPSLDPGGLILLKMLHTPTMLRTILTKRRYVYAVRLQQRYSDGVLRLQAVEPNSTRLIKQIHMEAKITLPVVLLRQSVHNTASYSLTPWAICNVENGTEN